MKNSVRLLSGETGEHPGDSASIGLSFIIGSYLLAFENFLWVGDRLDTKLKHGVFLSLNLPEEQGDIDSSFTTPNLISLPPCFGEYVDEDWILNLT